MPKRSLTIASVTVARSDYNIYLPVYRAIMAESDLRLQVVVGAAHLDPRYGHTVEMIERDAMPIADRVEMTQPGDTAMDIATAMARGVEGFAGSFARLRPDLLLVLGDRYEMLAAVAAAMPFNIPVAHIHGGESTEGSMDEMARHAITKMSHLHFTATDAYARRIVQMGEPPERVFVSGAPALDLIRELKPLSWPQLAATHALDLPERFLLVVYHPVTLDPGGTADQVKTLLDAIAASGIPGVFVYPNADTASHTIIKMVEAFVRESPQHRLVRNLVTEAYYATLAHAAVMVGNSSSGIIEATSFGLPVVNIGPRQQGRLRAKNVIDVPSDAAAISNAVERAISVDFRPGLAGLVNPYGDGHAAGRIVAALKQLPPRAELLTKRFHDAPPAPPAPPT